MTNTPLIIAHRGLHTTLPENSIAAVRAATDAGFTAVEVDIRQTRDGHFLLDHWPLSRRNPIPTRWQTANQVLTHRPQLDRLEDLLDTFPSGVQLLLECKNAHADVQHVHQLLIRAGMRDRTTIISFHPRVLTHWPDHGMRRALITPIGYGLSLRYGFGRRDPLPVAHALSVQGVIVRHDHATRSFVDRAHHLGLTVLPYHWVQSDAAALAVTRAAGVDGYISHQPVELRQLLTSV